LGTLDQELRTLTLTQLERVLDSTEFRLSEQSKRLLHYLVSRSLDGDATQLKERAIGIALFHFEDGYDTNSHPIVRVRVNEIRKRLAKYYQENPDQAVRFEIPAGSYRVEFKTSSLPVPVPAAAEDPSAPLKLKQLRWKYATVSVCLAAVLFGGFWLARPPDPLLTFWRPALRSSNSVIICTGNPVTYGFSRAFRQRMRGQPEDHFRSLTEPLKLGPADSASGGDIIPITNQYVGLGTADAIARISAWLGGHQKESQIRFGNDLSFSDLRQAPAVLIGAFQNRWTIEFAKGFRFVFTSANSVAEIRDTKDGKSWSLPHMADDGQTDEDYLVISRVFRSESGQFLVAAAGITQYGTRAAGEVLSNPELLAGALQQLKPGWEKRNLQLLFHVKVYADVPGLPVLVAYYQW
jgi:hypothetical protein